MIDVTVLIKDKIASSGRGLREIATDVKLSSATLSRLQNKKFRPNVDHVVILSRWLEVSIEEIVRFYATKI